MFAFLNPTTLLNLFQRLNQPILILVLSFFINQSVFAKPNVILIMADDLGSSALESYGGTSFSTPNLNLLSQEGVQFENMHVHPRVIKS